MIISKLKDKNEILKNLSNLQKIFVIGCSECATVCKSGGEEEAKEMCEFLAREGKEATGYIIIESPCVEAKAKMELLKSTKKINESDALLVLSCGLGTQVLAQSLRKSKRVIPGTDTLFAGAVFGRADDFKEYCSLCGNCILDKTAAICPHTRCSKGLLNGPCGGSKNGKCEVDRERDCAWMLIFKKLKEEGREEELLEIMPPKNFMDKNKPSKLKLENKNEPETVNRK